MGLDRAPSPVHMGPPEPDPSPLRVDVINGWPLICVTHYTGFTQIRQHIFYRVAVLARHRLLGIASVYLQELCRPD